MYEVQLGSRPSVLGTSIAARAREKEQGSLSLHPKLFDELLYIIALAGKRLVN
jgi:hypothetical protein